MATKEARGTKRTCQNSDCGQRFYDLHREPITCPYCQSAYVIASAPLAAAVVPEEAPKTNEAAFNNSEAVTPADAPEADAPELADIEAAEEPAAAEEDATFLEEEEEDGGDVTEIIGGVGEEDEEA